MFSVVVYTLYKIFIQITICVVMCFRVNRSWCRGARWCSAWSCTLYTKYTNYNMCGDVFQGESFVVPRGSLVFSVVVYTLYKIFIQITICVVMCFRVNRSWCRGARWCSAWSCTLYTKYTNYNMCGDVFQGESFVVPRGSLVFSVVVYTLYKIFIPITICGDVFQGESFVVPRGSLVFSVVVYTCCSVLAVTLLMVRRRFRMFGQAELGGPLVSKVLTAMLFFAMWIFYILISAMKAQNIITVDI